MKLVADEFIATGEFDPMCFVRLMVEQEAEAAEKAAGIAAEPIDAAHASEEERRRFRQVLEDRRRVREQAAQRSKQRLSSPRELQFARDIAVLFEQAAWIVEGVGFPDGQPLNKQNPSKARCWYTLVAAIRAVQAGSAAKKDNSDARQTDDGAPGRGDRDDHSPDGDAEAQRDG